MSSTTCIIFPKLLTVKVWLCIYISSMMQMDELLGQISTSSITVIQWSEPVMLFEGNIELLLYVMWCYSWDVKVSIFVWGWLLYGSDNWCHIILMQGDWMKNEASHTLVALIT
jgi:hypothetical protein